MPLVLAESEVTESGIRYADLTGVSYQYPIAYRNMIVPGERFVYYRGRKRAIGGRAQQVYFGCGIVGSVSPDPTHPERLMCTVLDYREFPRPVPFRRADGEYYESGGARRGYFQRGVRRVSEFDYANILSASGEAASDDQPPVPIWNDGHDYASQETASVVDEYAIRTAELELKDRFPGGQVESFPRNNPGFDLIVRNDGVPTFVEIKGTTRPSPRFFITEGELQFSRVNESQFLLGVIYAIDFKSWTHLSFWQSGPVTPQAGYLLQPVQWRGSVAR